MYRKVLKIRILRALWYTGGVSPAGGRKRRLADQRKAQAVGYGSLGLGDRERAPLPHPALTMRNCTVSRGTVHSEVDLQGRMWDLDGSSRGGHHHSLA